MSINKKAQALNRTQNIGAQNPWYGQVVSINDPLKSGRAQIRIVGHQDDDQKLQKENLFWAQIAFPPTHAQIPGSQTTHGLQVGASVMGFWQDHTQGQIPIITGVYNRPDEKARA